MHDESQEQAIRAKRRQWFKDRAAAARIATYGSRLVVARMDDGALWQALVHGLLDIQSEVNGRALPVVTQGVEDALAAALELRTRGTQLQLPLDEPTR